MSQGSPRADPQSRAVRHDLWLFRAAPTGPRVERVISHHGLPPMPVASRIFSAGSLLLLLAHAPPLRAEALPALEGGLVAGALFDELARMDSELFEASFVTCDAAKANAIFAEDVEFYHDKDGLSSGEEVRENTRRLTASCPGKNGVTRTVVPGSLRVYPIEGYGAAQVGMHRFDERGVATSTLARFVSVWRMQDGKWRLARVLSLDHQSVRAESGRSEPERTE